MADKRPILLSEPWFQRRYQQHRQKVATAVPAIDAQSPTVFAHVSFKCKKQQLEKERQTKIQDDNFFLLTRLSRIMNRKPLPSAPNSAKPRLRSHIVERLPPLSATGCTPTDRTDSRTMAPNRKPSIVSHTTGTVVELTQEPYKSLESLPPIPSVTPPSSCRVVPKKLRPAVSQPCVPHAAAQHSSFCGCKARSPSDVEDWEAWRARLLSPPPPPLPSPSPPPVLYPAVILLQKEGVACDLDTASSTP